MKNKQNKKGKEESLAFASLMEEIEKSRKKAKIFYISGLVLVVLAVFSFLLFGPVTVPVFSELGDKILNNTEIVEVEEEPKEDMVEEVEEPEEETKEETKEPEENVERKVTTTPTKTTTPKPTPEPEPTYLCTDAEIQEIRDAIKKIEGFRDVTEEEMNQALFDCFDYGLEHNPGQPDSYYQDVCYQSVCVDNSPICDLPDQFQQGIDDFQADLDRCLSDR